MKIVPFILVRVDRSKRVPLYVQGMLNAYSISIHLAELNALRTSRVRRRTTLRGQWLWASAIRRNRKYCNIKQFPNVRLPTYHRHTRTSPHSSWRTGLLVQRTWNTLLTLTLGPQCRIAVARLTRLISLTVLFSQIE